MCKQSEPVELVSVQGIDICAKSFERALNLVREAARPLCLVFKYQPAADMTADHHVVTLNHLRPQTLAYEHPSTLLPQPLDTDRNEGKGVNDLRLERYPGTVVARR